MKKVTRALIGVGLVAGLLGLAACSKDADVVSQNISNDADNFKVMRRVVFYNGITNDYILEVVGLCSLGNYDGNRRMSVTCKDGPDSYKKHFLGLSDNVTFFAEQVQPISASRFFYKVTFKPTIILPNINLGG